MWWFAYILFGLFVPLFAGRQNVNDFSKTTTTTSTPKSEEAIITPNPPPSFTCATNQFKCRKDNQCIQRSHVCDGIIDCSDKTDEEYCQPEKEVGRIKTTIPEPPPSFTCATNQFRCRYDNQCIQRSHVCDGIIDCSDKTDEEYCQPAKEIGRIMEINIKTSNVHYASGFLHKFDMNLCSDTGCCPIYNNIINNIAGQTITARGANLGYCQNFQVGENYMTIQLQTRSTDAWMMNGALISLTNGRTWICSNNKQFWLQSPNNSTYKLICYVYNK